MCGIMGYTGKRAAQTILLDGLKRLEYRGYDSAGIATLEGNKISLFKRKGRVENLEKSLRKIGFSVGEVGLGHTRWATHGTPNETNAHPHLSGDGFFAVVHNGIIENFSDLKSELEAEGVCFKSDTDTEVIPNLIAKYYSSDLLSAVRQAVNRLEGSFALGIVCSRHPDTIIGVKRFSPLLVGVGKDENFIASDLTAILPYTNRIFHMEDNEIAVVTPQTVLFYSADDKLIVKKPSEITDRTENTEKGDFEHFMLKEIYEQPDAIRRTILTYTKENRPCFEELDVNRIKSLHRVDFVACGSAYHAGVVGEYILERLARIPAKTHLASEYRYRRPIIDGDTLVVVISQSGETADTLAALRLAKEKGAYTLAVVNRENSTIAKEADGVLYTKAGVEIAVATTKGYTTQLVCLLLFGLWMAQTRGYSENLEAVFTSLRALPDAVDRLLSDPASVKALVPLLLSYKPPFFIGRGLDFAVALESSLKLKEISYIPSEVYAAGELKHGPISLITEDSLIFALSGSGELSTKLISNAFEAKARGGKVIFVGKAPPDEGHGSFISIPDLHPLVSPIAEIIPLQLLAYYTALELGCDIDKPRNLAKSVTVE